MAEAIGVASGIIGIVGFALQSIQQLVSTIDAVRDVPQNLHVVRQNLDTLTYNLDKLASVVGNGGLIEANTQLEQALERCRVDCDEFEGKLVDWTKHSRESAIGLRDKFQIGWLKVGAIRAFNDRILQSEGTLVVALGVINTYDNK